MTDLLILGAGPAGLGAAFKAAERGFDVTVLERAERVGGAAASIEVAGIRADLGSHRLHPSVDPVILGDLQGLLGNDLQRRDRHGRIHLLGGWIRFPLKLSDMVRRLPPWFVFGAVWDSITAPLRSARADTFEEILRAGLGPTICESFYFPYAKKIWGVDPGAISGEQARRRVTADSAWKVLGRVVMGSGAGGERGSGFFFYPKRGYGQISETLAEAAQDRGASIHLGAEVESVSADGSGVQVRCSDGSVHRAPFVFSTIPLPVLARLCDAPGDVLEAARQLRSRAMVLVYLVLACDRYTEFDAHYVPGESTPVTRISEPKNYRDGSGSDPAGRTVLCAEIPCMPGDGIWNGDDRALGEIVVEALSQTGAPPVPLEEVHTVRLSSAYPIYETGYEQRFEAVDAWISRQERLLTFGRQGLFAHDNAHHALAMAYSAVDALGANGDFDRAGWQRARERFAQHVVED